MDKIDRYFTRTLEHIQRVQNNTLYLVINHKGFSFSAANEKFVLDEETCRELMYNVTKHDQSKFSTIQFKPYIESTEYYHQRNNLNNKDYDYPNSQVKFDVDMAVANHYNMENHHPEKYKGLAKKMSFVELVETVCDLQAMAQEFNEGSCRGYFENVWKKKQSENFYDDWDWEVVKEFMNQIINLFEKDIKC